jgi:hypothetical protein
VRKTLRHRILNIYDQNKSHDIDFVTVDQATLQILGPEPIGDLIEVRVSNTDLRRGFILVGARGWVYEGHVCFDPRKPITKECWLRDSEGVIHLMKPRIGVGVHYGEGYNLQRRNLASSYDDPQEQHLYYECVLCHTVEEGQIWAPPDMRKSYRIVASLSTIEEAPGRMARIPVVTLGLPRSPYPHNEPEFIQVALPELYNDWNYAIVAPTRMTADPVHTAYDKLMDEDLF